MFPCARATSTRPPVERDAYDLVVIHQVLHFLDDPARALAEAARALAPGGRLAVVDFDAHDQEFLRDEFAHRRLGFAVDEVEGYLAEAGLAAIRAERVPPAKGEAGKLTVALWIAEDPRVISDDFPEARRGVRLMAAKPVPLSRAGAQCSGLVRVLPAQDGGNGGAAYGRRRPGSSR